VWVGECFFWYRLTRVVPDKIQRAVKRLCVCVCVCVCVASWKCLPENGALIFVCYWFVFFRIRWNRRYHCASLSADWLEEYQLVNISERARYVSVSVQTWLHYVHRMKLFHAEKNCIPCVWPWCISMAAAGCTYPYVGYGEWLCSGFRTFWTHYWLVTV